LNNSFKIVFVISSYRDWDLNRGNHQIKEFPKGCWLFFEQYAWGSRIFRRDCIGGYRSRVSAPLGFSYCFTSTLPSIYQPSLYITHTLDV